jgi:predicted dehydrogenase
VVEKPFALTVAECDRIISAARRNRRMVSAFHNRHWDGNILTIRKHLHRIGRPFRWESYVGEYRKPPAWWRSDRQISGGLIYDWGAHFVEWMLQVMTDRIREITGYAQEGIWAETSNEDEVEAVVRFEGGAVGSHTQSQVSAADKPTIRICGTRGAIMADHSAVTIHTRLRGRDCVARTVPLEARRWENYYANIRDHLTKGEPLAITAEWARRVVQVLEYAGRSARQGRALRPRYP